MALSIGEMAQRLRITVRALRHYEQVGLLLPASVDPRSGYRSYSEAQLVRGVQIEQLKAAGLALADIRSVLDSDTPTLSEVLASRRSEIDKAVREHRRQLDTIDAVLAQRTELGQPEDVEVPDGLAVISRATSDHAHLARTIRRLIQRIAREARQNDGVRCRSFSARFPLDVTDGDIEVEVAGHVDLPTHRTSVLAGERQLRLQVVGHLAMLPLAYDIVLGVARERGHHPTGTVVEHYLDLAAVGRTVVAVPIERDHARGAIEMAS